MVEGAFKTIPGIEEEMRIHLVSQHHPTRLLGQDFRPVRPLLLPEDRKLATDDGIGCHHREQGNILLETVHKEETELLHQDIAKNEMDKPLLLEIYRTRQLFTKNLY